MKGKNEKSFSIRSMFSGKKEMWWWQRWCFSFSYFSEIIEIARKHTKNLIKISLLENKKKIEKKEENEEGKKKVGRGRRRERRKREGKNEKKKKSKKKRKDKSYKNSTLRRVIEYSRV